jgi:hypothetical protein
MEARNKITNRKRIRGVKRSDPEMETSVPTTAMLKFEKIPVVEQNRNVALEM